MQLDGQSSGLRRVGLPNWLLKLQRNGVQLHLLGFSVPPLARMIPCHKSTLHWASGISNESKYVVLLPMRWVV